MNQYIYETSIGFILIKEEKDFITEIRFLRKEENFILSSLKESTLTRKAFLQLEEYFKGERQIFDLPLSARGTPFQKRVWQELCNIPYGETRSYQDIAISIGSPKASRAIGMANHHNPILIVVPCHRVIGKNGKLVGYGCGLPLKEQLLNLEKEVKNKECS